MAFEIPDLIVLGWLIGLIMGWILRIYFEREMKKLEEMPKKYVE